MSAPRTEPAGIRRPARLDYNWVILVSAAVTALFTVVLATNIAPWVRGPKAWRWPYAIPGTLHRLWLPALMLSLYAALAWWLDSAAAGPSRPASESGSPVRKAWPPLAAIVVAMVMTPAIQFALLYMDHPDIRSQLFYRTVSERANGFFNVGAVVMDRDDFMRHYAERMIDWYPTHPERHPPGLPVLFSLSRQFFDANPRLSARLNDLYRTYQCHNVPLMNLPDGAIASATLQMMVPLFLSAIVPVLYLLGREVYGRNAALRAVLLWPLVPGIALWAGYWTPLYALCTVLVLLLIHCGLSRRRLACLLSGGVVFSVSLFLTFGNATIVGFAGLYALVWLVRARPRPSWRWLLAGALLFGLGVASLWLWLWFRHGLSFFAVWRTAIGKHLEMGGRGGWFWALYNLYDFFVAAAGIPIMILWALHTFGAVRNVWAQRQVWANQGFWGQPPSKPTRRESVPQEPSIRRVRWMDTLALSFLIGLLAMDTAGISRGEVARVWAFLLPLPLLVAVSRLPRHGIAFRGTVLLLSAQLFVTNIYVRYIGTDLSDPPSPPPVAQIHEETWTPWNARWEHGPALQAIQAPSVIAVGDAITVGAVWTSDQPIRRPYTVFVHLYDVAGKLVAQRDTMPLEGHWPTPCWQPGDSFQDSYTLVPLGSTSPGAYRLELGVYWLPTGERLPVQGQGAQPSYTVHLGSITVEESE
jgi:hypothetical protein